MRLLLIHLLSIWCAACIAQVSAYERSYTTEDGLISDVVYNIEQDNDGYIWMATEGGLNKFNGSTFENYAFAEGLPHNELVGLEKDCEGRIWINSIGPLAYIQDGGFQSIDQPIQQSISMNFRVICHDSILWHVTGHQVSAFSQDLAEVREVPPELQHDILYVKILDVYADSLWVNVGSTVYILKHGVVQDSFAVAAGLDDSYTIPLIHHYEAPYFYYVFDGHLYQYNRSTGENVVLYDDIPVIDYVSQVQDMLHLHRKQGGHMAFRINEKSELKYVGDVDDGKMTTTIIKDSEGNTWQSYYSGGISFRPKENPNILHHTAEEFSFLKSVESLLWTSDGLWIGTADAQLIRYREDDWKVIDLPDSNKFGITRINDIKELDAETLLISSDVGLYLLRDDVMSILFRSAIKKISIQDDDIIVNTHAAALRMSRACIEEMAVSAQQDTSIKQTQKYPCIEELLEGRSYSSAINARGQKLIGSLSKGLVRFDERGRIDFGAHTDLLRVNINEIAVLHDSTFLVGTKGRGLYVINDDQVKVIDNSSGLTSGIIYDIAVDGSKVFLATNNGLNIIQDITAEKLIIQSLTQVNGLLKDQIKAIEISDGLLYIASTEGLSFLNVSADSEINDEARVVIDKIIVNAEEVGIRDILNLESDQNNIVIQFANLNFSYADDTNYAYRLKGVDDEWRVTQSREVSYNNLKPDDYTFELAHAGAELSDPSKIRSVIFDIEVPFLQSSLAKFLFIISAIGLVYLLFYALTSRSNMHVLESKVLERTKSLSLKVKEINNINRQLERSNQELQDYAYATSHDLKSPLRTISSFVSLLKRRNEENFTEKDNEYVSFIVKGVERMNQVVQDLLDLSKVSINKSAEQIDSGQILSGVLDDLQYQISEKQVDVSKIGVFPSLMMEPTKLKQLFQNLITNAIKYNEDDAPKILIESEQDDRHHIFRISDNGIGIEIQYRVSIFDIFKRLHSSEAYEGTGIGLAICRKIVESYHGTISCESSQLGGVSFVIRLPR